MVGWLLVGAALMYVFPWAVDRLLNSDLTHRWMTTLGRSGYNPLLGWVGGGSILVVTVAANVVWHQRFEGKI